jgi:hypothetical protein
MVMRMVLPIIIFLLVSCSIFYSPFGIVHSVQQKRNFSKSSVSGHVIGMNHILYGARYVHMNVGTQRSSEIGGRIAGRDEHPSTNNGEAPDERLYETCLGIQAHSSRYQA